MKYESNKKKSAPDFAEPICYVYFIAIYDIKFIVNNKNALFFLIGDINCVFKKHFEAS